jgi:SpoVK/Ycf46/Vps4 family AAA+-type ATPase
MVCESLSEVNDRLTESPYVVAIEVPMPDHAARQRFVTARQGSVPDSDDSSDRLTSGQLVSNSNGLSLLSLDQLLAHTARTGGATSRQFRELKKTAIERQCGGFLEFVEPKHTLDLVVGHETACDRLREDARLISNGHLEAAPMGYLVCGPVGTGKTFLAECYAGSIGIPCVKLKNFRSKYVGETEGNLQRVLTVLRSLGPVIVIIDEADAALGDRNQEGDSGTSGRIFSMIAQQMGDTRYRGRIIWMLLTCRPDLLPIDLKRQGRAEVHIPLFYPDNEQEIRNMFQVMARKNKVNLEISELHLQERHKELSGADIESVVLAARRRALLDGRDTVTSEDVDKSLGEFIPSAQGLEKDMQEAAAVLECTQMDFLNAQWRKTLESEGGRAKLQQQLNHMRNLVENM